MEKHHQERQEIPVQETVRCAMYHRGKFLLLQKDTSSKNPGVLEFPGGKIDSLGDALPGEAEQMQTVEREVEEETGVSISGMPLQKIEEFDYYFEAANQSYMRRVHLFLVRIPDEREVDVILNAKQTTEGQPEDKHASYQWVEPEFLRTSIKKIGKNSRHVKKLLKVSTE